MSKFIDGKPLPNTEETGKKVTHPHGNYKPMAFGPIGRAWQPRPKYAGTYDQKWLDEVFPFLPANFKEDYCQAAPVDQQIDYPQGGEEVELLNLTGGGRTFFALPRVDIPIEFNGRTCSETTQPVCDAIVLEPDQQHFLLTWRVSCLLKRNLFEIDQVVVGRMPRGWYHAREAYKPYYANLAELIDVQE